ncbi:MAG: hypothetical protein HY870_24145 [Chloroflexi bacterium]|nr:hypothetical protein [Chloroflexota bacterium]
MTRLVKASLVLGGYAAAFFAASATVAVHIALTSGPVAQASSGMYAFGDFVLFVAVFGLLALVPTALGLYFLRPIGKFWSSLSVLAVVVAVSGVVAAGLIMLTFGTITGTIWNFISAILLLRVMGAPLLAVGDLVSALIAPAKQPRRRLLIGAAIECAVSVFAALRFLFLLLMVDQPY